MTAAQDPPGKVEPIEQFRPTSGRLVGYVSLGVIAGLVVHLALGGPTTTGLRVGTGLLFLAVLVWVTQLRPRAAVYPDVLRLRGSLRDVDVPLTVIDEVSVRRVLEVRAGGERYVNVGIGKPLRAMVRGRGRGPSSLLGWDRLEAYTEESTPPTPDRSAMSYQDFVQTRITDLAEDARRRARPGTAGAAAARPLGSWAWPEIVGLVGTGAALGVALLL